MRRTLVALAFVTVAAAAVTGLSVAKDRPFDTSRLVAMKWLPALAEKDLGGPGNTGAGGPFSKSQIESFRCESSGDPAAAVDISCNTEEYGQNFNPDNEIAIAVDPEDPDRLLAGSNDYFYRFNNSTGARQVIVPTGFFYSEDGGATWVDGQVPMQSGNGAGDPAPAFDAKHDVMLMAQLENTQGQGGPFVAQGDVSVSRSPDGEIAWSEPVTVMQGRGAGIGPANGAVFYDKVWMAVDNNPGSDFYGRIYVTSSRFLNGLHGSYAESPIVLSHSDDGGLTWTEPEEISGSHPSCTFQSSGSGTECDEDQNSIPVVASDGTLYVYFANGQNEAEWEVPADLDNQIMVVRSTDGGETFGDPVQVAQREDGISDMPWSVIARQTVWGHQIRWSGDGNIAVDPTDPEHLTVVWSERGTPNPNATEECVAEVPGEAPSYDPCNAGPGAVVSVYVSSSTDGGATWSAKTQLSASANHQWFPWAGYKPDGTLVAAWDQDTAPAVGDPPANDTFEHVLWDGSSVSALGLEEHIDESLTHWTGQYVPEADWPVVCGPVGYADPPVTDAEGKDCNVFHGDYTGLAVGSDGSVNVVWTGLNRRAESPQVDPYTGGLHDGYVQDAMFARR